MRKFTPGPWSTNHFQNGSTPVNVFGVYGDGAELFRTSSREVEENEANARLIAAAPELYEALQIILVQFGEYRDGDGAAKLHAITIAKDALAKAEWRTP